MSAWCRNCGRGSLVREGRLIRSCSENCQLCTFAQNVTLSPINIVCRASFIAATDEPIACTVMLAQKLQHRFSGVV